MRCRLRSLVILCVTLMLAGCASEGVPVSVAFDPLARFPATATWAWDRDAIRLPRDPNIAEMQLEQVIEQVAEDAFALRGYTRVDDMKSAGYHLSYHFQVARFIAADGSSATGTLSFLLVEPERERRVWTGWGRAEFFVGAEPEERRLRLADAMARMLEDFPPNQSGPE